MHQVTQSAENGCDRFQQYCDSHLNTVTSKYRAGWHIAQERGVRPIDSHTVVVQAKAQRIESLEVVRAPVKTNHTGGATEGASADLSWPSASTARVLSFDTSPPMLFASARRGPAREVGPPAVCQINITPLQHLQFKNFKNSSNGELVWIQLIFKAI